MKEEYVGFKWWVAECHDGSWVARHKDQEFDGFKSYQDAVDFVEYMISETREAQAH